MVRVWEIVLVVLLVFVNSCRFLIFMDVFIGLVIFMMILLVAIVFWWESIILVRVFKIINGLWDSKFCNCMVNIELDFNLSF